MLEFVYPTWKAPKNIKALTTTRKGGVSLAPYSGLNVGEHVGDELKYVEQNRTLVTDFIKHQYAENKAFENKGSVNKSSAINSIKLLTPELPKLEPHWLRQEHTTKIVTDSNKNDLTQAYDGQFSQQKSVVCAIMTADCMPVFICNSLGTEIALVHAGWRGFADGIVEKAMNMFQGSEDQLLVHCGPAISQRHFEIGDEVRQQLGGSDCFFRDNINKKGHCFADLVGLLGERVSARGAQFTHSGYCTYADRDQFFSYRRENMTGRMVSLLWME